MTVPEVFEINSVEDIQQLLDLGATVVKITGPTNGGCFLAYGTLPEVPADSKD